MRAVHDAGIEAVIDLAMMCPPATPTRELVYLRFPLVDGAGNPPWVLRTAVNAVRELIRLAVPTLVACDGGMSRSLVVVTAALWSEESDVPPDEVLRRVRGDGPADIHPLLWDEVVRVGTLPGVYTPGYALSPPSGASDGSEPRSGDSA